MFECADGRWVHQWPLKPLTVIQAAEHESLADAPVPQFDKRRTDPNRIGMEPSAIIELFHWFPLMQEAFKQVSRCGVGGVGRAGARRLPADPLARGGPERRLTRWSTDVSSKWMIPNSGRIRHLGLLNDFSAAPGRVQGPAPRRGEHKAAPLPAQARSMGSTPETHHPLDGIVVIDLGLALAGPFAARYCPTSAPTSSRSTHRGTSGGSTPPWDRWPIEANAACVSISQNP